MANTLLTVLKAKASGKNLIQAINAAGLPATVSQMKDFPSGSVTNFAIPSPSTTPLSTPTSSLSDFLARAKAPNAAEAAKKAKDAAAAAAAAAAMGKTGGISLNPVLPDNKEVKDTTGSSITDIIGGAIGGVLNLIPGQPLSGIVGSFKSSEQGYNYLTGRTGATKKHHRHGATYYRNRYKTLVWKRKYERLKWS